MTKHHTASFGEVSVHAVLASNSILVATMPAWSEDADFRPVGTASTEALAGQMGLRLNPVSAGSEGSDRASAGDRDEVRGEEGLLDWLEGMAWFPGG